MNRRWTCPALLISALGGCGIYLTGCAAANDSQLSRTELQVKFEALLGRPGIEVVRELGLAEADCSIIDEPPMILRGTGFNYRGASIVLYVADGEPHHRDFIIDRKPSCADVLRSRVGGIQLWSQPSIAVGSAVPLQWRPIR